jgi:hypothetical protein
MKVVGANFQQTDFKVTQGHGETRICSAARVPAIIVGVSEGLDSATYSNYGQARRAFADLTMRPLWRNFAASLSNVLTVPGGSELWYDDRDIPFLREDETAAAEVQTQQAAQITSLINAGFKPDVAVEAVMAGDLGRLARGHSGLVSVQLLPPGTSSDANAGANSTPAPNSANANGGGRDLLAELGPLLLPRGSA